MDRTERTGLAIAVAGHVLLFALLSLGLVSKARLPSVSEPMDVQFVDAIGLKSAAPHPATEAPAESQAPEVAKPEEPAPAPEPTPTPPAPKPKPAPEPKPKPEPKPAPKPKPAEKPTPKAAPTEDKEPRRRPDHQEQQAKATPQPKPTKAKGSLLGPDFLKGIVPMKSAGKAQTPRASSVSAQAMAGLGAAIRRQIQPCYNLGALEGTPAMDIVTTLELKFNRDGTVANIGTEAQQTGVNASNQHYRRQIAEVARSAVLRCAPLRLPANLYEGGWEDIQFTFTPKQLG